MKEVKLIFGMLFCFINISYSQNNNSSIYGRVWSPINTPVANGYVFVTNEDISILYGEALTLNQKVGEMQIGSYKIEGLPAGKKLCIYTFHEGIPGRNGYQEIILQENELRRVILDINLSFQDPGLIKNVFFRIPTLLKQANMAESADKVIEQLLELKKNTTLSSSAWEGGAWRGNGYIGIWFPETNQDTFFGIDDYSWGQIRTLSSINYNQAIQINTKILLNSSGVNFDAAYFGFAKSWVNYSGYSCGICFKNSEIVFYENSNMNDFKYYTKLGTYTAGQNIIFNISYASDGTVIVSSNNFSGSYKFNTVVSSPRCVISIKDANASNGFIIRGINM